MAYAINTHIASLQAQNYLRVTSEFQDKTINRVTSGLRILSSGDDAAGLAIANSFRSDRSVLTQGVRNANDGLSTLQTIDGGMNNISQLLDRARTLAAQSASGTFTGDRDVLNSEFSSVMAEIDRQAQSIGLNISGEFARSLSVFIGGGKASGSTTAITNGSVSVDLSASTVDSRSLGLTKLAITGSGDFLAGSTSVAAINTAPGNGGADTPAIFNFYGPGFGDHTTSFSLSVTMGATIVDGQSLVNAINGAINGLTADSAVKKAFKDAGIQAGLSPDAKKLVFTSPDSAFQVHGYNAKAAAFLGASGATAPANWLSTNGVVQVGSSPFSWDAIDNGTQAITISTTDSAGVLHSISILLDTTSGANFDAALTKINGDLQASNDVELKKVLAVDEGAATMRFISTTKSFTVTLGVEGGLTANEGIGGLANQGKIFDSWARGTATQCRYQHRVGRAVCRLCSVYCHLLAGRCSGRRRQGSEPAFLRHQPRAVPVVQPRRRRIAYS